MNTDVTTYSDDYLNVPIYDYSESSSQTYHISRHLNSCNNMVDDAKWTNASYKFSEPPLSLWGIISGLALQRSPTGIFENKVYVSCLVRTWMTAIIEYLPHCKISDTGIFILSLTVSPYIKEADLSNKYYVGQTIDVGNMPESVDEQVSKIKYFFSFLILFDEYLKKMHSQTSDETKVHSFNNDISTIREKLDKILTHGNKINIIFPKFTVIRNKKTIEISYNISLKYDETIKKLVSTYELFENGKNINKNSTKYEIDPYSYKTDKNIDYSLELDQTGGNDDKNYQYFESMLKSFLEQNSLNKNRDEVISLDEQFKKIKINSTVKKSGFFNKIPNISAYKKSFGKESVLLFINWIKNVVRDDDKNIYIVAHSNIMQATLYNICEKIKGTTITKHNVNNCHEGLHDIVRKQNIWELILRVDEDMYITSASIRHGQEYPNAKSKNKLNYNDEKMLSCGKNINTIEKMAENLTKKNNKNKIRIQKSVKMPSSLPTSVKSKGMWSKFKGIFEKKGGNKTKRNKKKCRRNTHKIY